MSRVIQTKPAARQRKERMRDLALALRRGSESDVGTEELHDLFAFMLATLKEINALVDRTTQAWEKRGYWLKADRFRLDWEWSLKGEQLLGESLGSRDVEAARDALPDLIQAVMKVHIPKKTLDAEPWHGAWSAFAARAARTGPPGS